ncbi:hypothetical protein HNQ41_000534 [Texcoconibacillus texcoconensis]|uniref:Uncharacterized protein n=1 Tax=Texcoconibacillus texcoconensis TaxID=1095777 RepID=A0A840QM26_9BACI|nr:hypothetical protein [Texcoconibacillus texcoconensis]
MANRGKITFNTLLCKNLELFGAFSVRAYDRLFHKTPAFSGSSRTHVPLLVKIHAVLLCFIE